MKKYLALILAMIMALSLIACSKENPENNDPPENGTGSETFVVGCLLPLSGTNQLDGQYYQNGLELAKTEINAAGGILGKEVVIQYEDCGTNDQEMARNAALKLVDDGVQVIIGSYMSNNSLAVMDDIEEAEVVLFALGTSPDISAKGYEYTWQPRILETQRAGVYADIAMDIFDAKNIAVISVTNSSSMVSTKRMIEKLKDTYGIEIPESQIIYAAEDETNFTSAIATILGSGADTLFCNGGTAPFAIPFAQQFYDAGGYSKMNLVGANVFAATAFLESVSAEASSGWYNASDWSPDLLDYADQLEGIPEEAIKFEAAYREMFKDRSADKSVWSYDCLYMTKFACEQAGTTESGAAINDGLKKVDYQGVGSYYRAGDDLHNVLGCDVLVGVTENGKNIPVKFLALKPTRESESSLLSHPKQNSGRILFLLLANTILMQCVNGGSKSGSPLTR